MHHLTSEDKQTYLQEVVIPNFKPFINQPVFSAIYNDKCEIVICTNYSAKAIGFDKWQDLVGVSYRDAPVLAERVFGSKYTTEHREEIFRYINTILDIQQSVFIKKRIVSFFDLLPYNGTFRSTLVTYTPIFHLSGEVVALQTFSHISKFFGFQEHFFQLTSSPLNKKYPSRTDLTRREHEIMFLLANGLGQDQIAKTLELSRSTIASVIASQLGPKFNIAGANTNLLTKIAIDLGYFQHIPESLYRPFVVSLVPEE